MKLPHLLLLLPITTGWLAAQTDAPSAPPPKPKVVAEAPPVPAAPPKPKIVEDGEGPVKPPAPSLDPSTSPPAPTPVPTPVPNPVPEPKLTPPKPKIIPETPSPETPGSEQPAKPTPVPPTPTPSTPPSSPPAVSPVPTPPPPPMEEKKAEAPQKKETETPKKPLEPSPPPEEKEAPRKVKAVIAEPMPLPPPKTTPKETKPQIPLTDKNDKEARTLFLTIPAPRGEIVDRNGNPLAQNKMAHFLGVEFHLPPTATDADILRYAKQRIAYIQKQLPDGWDIEDSKIIEHYKNRRWMPMLANRPLPTEATEELKKNLPHGVVAQPCYLRVYPNGNLACHMLGELGKTGKFATGPIQNGDAIWPSTIGKAGLEQRFEEALAGTPGRINLVFGAGSEKLTEELVENPKPGKTIVTALDLEMQRLVERVLRNRTKRGAMVIVDVATGDVLAMASNPSYDPNLFAFGVRDADYKRLLTEKNIPLLNRAFGAGGYPPASTFKVMTALAALESGKIDGGTYYDCDANLLIGNRYFHNWNKSSEGPMNVVDAIKRSCNTWFYKAALAIGATPVTSMATRFGLGDNTGLCLPESTGRIPTPEYWRKKYGENLTQGHLANISIGQSDTLVTPLQDALMMAGIARGQSVPRARLVQQVQELDGTITEFFPPEKRGDLGLQPESLRLVRAGMRAVVEESDGTGKAARNDYVKVAGKTGTAQWKIDKETGSWIHMAWFAGFIPADNPQYAYAAVYEGDPDEDAISGGKKVAPLVGDVFDEIYDKKKKHGEPMTGPAQNGDDKKSEDHTEQVRRAKPVPKAQPAPAEEEKPVVEPAPRETGLRGLWKKLFRKG